MSFQWKNGKSWVYSITYDEGFAGLLEHVVPLHRRYGIPGHVALVAGQIGVPRDVPGSSYNGWPILSRDEILMLCDEGWGVSCHSLTHQDIREHNAEEEVVYSRQLLQETQGMEVTTFCVPGDNDGYPATLALAERAGYNAILTIYDEVNKPDGDLFRLARCPIHTQYPGPFFSSFDPYKRLHQAMDCNGWIIDYCHCPMPGSAHHPNKDCSLEELAERFETVLRVGGDNVWLAEPNDVIAELATARQSSARQSSARLR